MPLIIDSSASRYLLEIDLDGQVLGIFALLFPYVFYGLDDIIATLYPLWKVLRPVRSDPHDKQNQ